MCRPRFLGHEAVDQDTAALERQAEGDHPAKHIKRSGVWETGKESIPFLGEFK